MRPPMPMHRAGGGPPGTHFLTEEEKENRPKVTKALLKRIFSYLKPYIPQFVVVFTALLISALLGLVPSVITGKIIDLIGSADASVRTLLILLFTAFITLILSQIISVAESYVNSWISQHVIFDMKNEMYRHLEYMSHSFFTSEKQGDIITRMNSDVDGVSSVISGTLTSIVSNILTIVTTVVAMFTINWKLSAIGLIIVPLLVIPTKSAGKNRFKYLTLSREKHDELNQHISETLSVSGSMLVKLFTKEEAEYEKFKQINKDVTGFNIKELRAVSWFRVIMGMFIEVGPLLIYFFGGLLIITKFDTALTVGSITVIVSLVNRIYRPIRSLFDIEVDFIRSLALFIRIFDYLDMPITVKDNEHPLCPDLSVPEIKFSDVCFAYTSEKPVLKGVNFTVPGGKMYAIVGESGAGKSTVIGMIPRLYDTDSGTVYISGTPVKDFSLKYLRSNIGIVTQDTYLFNGTIMENLKYAKPDATDEEIYSACKSADISNFIDSLPQKYGTVVGNRGLKLSGGEKQRISIARVLLKNPKILILDEATSSLDSISENSIQSALETVMKGRTSIVIAHRLSTILAADCILVIENGVISAEGTHSELLKSSPKYRQLYETQFKKVLDISANERNNKYE